MNRYKAGLIALNLVALLAYINYSIAQKEKLSKEGQLLLLDLAPKDPRSLMQGDYMRLRYSIGQEVEGELPKRGYLVVRLDSLGVANRVRFQEKNHPLNPGEYLINYTAENNLSVNIGAESYFFQEGEAEKYEHARYGGVKVDDKGNSLLIGLYTEDRQLIE